MASLNKLPPFSPVLNRLLATLASEDISFAKVADLIEKDVVLAGSVLGIVNSALFARRAKVNSVRHAVSLLGVDKLRNAALGMSITRLWGKVRTPPGWSMAAFNLHAIGTAILSDLLSQEAAVAYPEGAFVAGLLHDFGLLLIAIGLPDAYTEIERLCVKEGLTGVESEMQVLGFTHAEMSAEVLHTWNLPEPIQIAARYCMDPESDRTVTEFGQHPLSQVVSLADAYVNRLNIRIHTGIRPLDRNIELDIAALKLESHIARMLEEFTTEYGAIKDLI